tara:strand:- start:242 stop:559 length:318 start_codon:yes stop_codon:yes gene_type:complete
MYRDQISFSTKERRFITELRWFRYCLPFHLSDGRSQIKTPPFRAKGDPMTHWINYIKAGIQSLRKGRIWNLFKTRFKQVDNPYGGHLNRIGTINENISWWNGQKF